LAGLFGHGGIFFQLKEKSFIVTVVGSDRTGEGFLTCLGNHSSHGLAGTRFPAKSFLQLKFFKIKKFLSGFTLTLWCVGRWLILPLQVIKLVGQRVVGCAGYFT
jgi:hypothetical protein